MTKAAFAHLATSGTILSVRATPRARKPGLRHDGTTFHIAVAAAPTDGKANIAITEALAHALGIAKTRLTLVRGESARDKTFRID